MDFYSIADLKLKMNFFGNIIKKRSQKYILTEKISKPQISIETFKKDNLVIYGDILFQTSQKCVSIENNLRILSSIEDGKIIRQIISNEQMTDIQIFYSGLFRKYPQLTLDELELSDTSSVFSNALLEFSGFCIHSSGIMFQKKAFLFSGPSGTGKTTHTKLWQQHFGKDSVQIINDDRPAVRKAKDCFLAYGTPWSGTSPVNINVSAQLGAIIFLKQGITNRIRSLSVKEALKWLIYQATFSQRNPKKCEKAIALLENIINEVPLYELTCTISEQAVETVYKKLKEDHILCE